MTNPVGGFTKQVAPVLEVTASSAYSSGDVLGGALELPAAVRHAGASAILNTLLVTDVEEQDAAIELLIFDREPTQTYTDHEACPELDEDIAFLIAKVTIANGDYVSVGGLAINDISGLGRPLKAAKGVSSLWVVPVLGGTPTYGATTDVRMLFAFLQD
jgi:hypothetical protein